MVCSGGRKKFPPFWTHYLFFPFFLCWGFRGGGKILFISLCCPYQEGMEIAVVTKNIMQLVVQCHLTLSFWRFKGDLLSQEVYAYSLARGGQGREQTGRTFILNSQHVPAPFLLRQGSNWCQNFPRHSKQMPCTRGQGGQLFWSFTINFSFQEVYVF